MNLNDFVNNLPNEIQRKIISLLDIDRRRALGIYIKLKIPLKIKNDLEFILKRFKIKTISNPNFPNLNIAILDLNSVYIIKHEWYIRPGSGYLNKYK